MGRSFGLDKTSALCKISKEMQFYRPEDIKSTKGRPTDGKVDESDVLEAKQRVARESHKRIRY